MLNWYVNMTYFQANYLKTFASCYYEQNLTCFVIHWTEMEVAQFNRML